MNNIEELLWLAAGWNYKKLEGYWRPDPEEDEDEEDEWWDVEEETADDEGWY